MSAMIRLFSPHDAGSYVGTERRKSLRLTSCFLPPKINSGGTVASFGLQSVHQFFGQVGKSDPHTRLASTVLSRKGTLGEERLTMDQKNGDGFAKRANAIKPADLVAEAAEWAARLTNEAERKTGKTDTALETVARQTGVNQSTLWRLRYRKPKDLAVSVYMKLKTAFEAAEQRQIERLQHEAEIARSLGEANNSVLLRAADYMVSSHEKQVAVGKINFGGAGD